MIYAQPVSLKPVGRPIAAIPIKSTGSPLQPSPVGYGPPRPVPYPSGGLSPSSYGNGGGPPPLRPRPGPAYGPISRPPPQVFESEAAESYRPKQPIVGGSIPSVTLPAGGVQLQQHVHHHYHHGGDSGIDGVKASSVVDPGFSPVGGPLYGGLQNLNNEGSSLYGQSNLNSYGGNFENYETPGGPLYKKQFNLKPPATSKSLFYLN